MDYAATSFAGGSGTAQYPYLISNAAELAYLAKTCNAGELYSSTYFKQTADIFLGGHDWEPIGNTFKNNGSFCGNYDGGGYNIFNMYINMPDTGERGLFGRTGGGSTIKNANIKSSTVIGGGESVGALIGMADAATYISDCKVEANVRGGDLVGGIVGYIWTGSASNCNFSGSVSGNSQVGGIIGRIHSISTHSCVNYGQVSASGDYGGGIAGYVNNQNTLIDFCQNKGSVSVAGSNAGGIAGYANGTIKNCIANCVIESRGGAIGGIVGQTAVESVVIENCLASCQLLGSSVNVGAFVGTYRGKIKNCTFIGGSNLAVGAYYGNVYDDNASIESCYSYINGKGYYSNGTFEDFGYIASLNSGFPVQKSLFHVANAAPSVSGSWFSAKGFTLTNL